ncbi:CDP-diacylglycerol diphosphatase [Mycobacterium decipiens]|uniref:CDP-diacylglycerol pyrophosphatase n=2 Tax=Mycobacterium decipiens TaxID=1430326 RepID=A0A1X2LPY6_9MYCO|nr:CDP-diacylglycerol diphosphatase [Mycobacterium decipiens]
MSRRQVGRRVLIGAVLATLTGALIFASMPAPPNRPTADRDALWKIVHDRCEFGYRRTGAYAPCTLVDEDSGTALYKANFDPYQFLLLPLARITGIEDPALREPARRNYLYDAWAARFLVTSRLNNSLPESDVVLTINPKNARTQDQLHIHISCSSTTTSAVLKQVDASEYSGWKQLPSDLGGHTFQGLAVSTKTLESKNLFGDIYLKVTADHKKMENASVAVAHLAQDRFLLLLAEGTEDEPVAAEILQDHDCSIAKPW